MDGKYSDIMKAKVRDIGYEVKVPSRVCDDLDCPFHGKLPIRGKIAQGTVTSVKMTKTVIVERDYIMFSQKFERYERRRRKTPAHKPGCIDLEKGDMVRIAECRPLSKTKHFVVIEKVDKPK